MEKCLIILCLFISVCIDRSFLQNSVQCGVQQIRIRELIVHGRATVPGEWPWHTAIFHRKNRAFSYVCGGTLISHTFVITAAHCVKGENGYQLNSRLIFVLLGVHNLNVMSGKNIQHHDVATVHEPSKTTSQSFKNDIALLELATIADFNEYVQPACLSLTKELTGKIGTVVGWGVTEDEELSPTLKSAQIPAIDSVECLESNRDWIGATLDRGMFCAGYTNGTSVCNGDSGGGLVFEKDNVWYLGGIVSFSQAHDFYRNRCYTKGYTVFTKIYFYLKWISSITKQQFLTSYDDTVFNRSVIANDPTNLLPEDCGVYSISRIRRGKKAKLFEFPWMAILRYRHDDGSYITNVWCAGTLVSKRYVLTTAYCSIKPMFGAPVEVRLGEFNTEQDPDCSEIDGERRCAPPMKEYGIERIIRHQNFTSLWKGNDIALLRLAEDVGFKDHIKPICLPVTQSLKYLSLSKYITTGWGIMDEMSDPSVLLKATVSTANMPNCYENPKVDDIICTSGTNRTGPCRGDEGGPLGFPARHIDGMRFVQFGIISYGASCGGGEFSRHTNLSIHMDWIVQNMEP